MFNKVVYFFLKNKVITFTLLFFLILAGMVTSPFGSGDKVIENASVAVDAIPDIGENQQIVFTRWSGRSPHDIEDQITYPLTTALLGIPGVRTIRSSSMFGFSTIYVIFEDGVEFYWSRSRILEKLNSLPGGTLPEAIKPSLGPDATGLGQIFWYTLEGFDEDGKRTGGWDLDELRTIQDYYVKYSLASSKGVSEVASVGGHVKEYQIDLIPAAMDATGITVDNVIMAVKNSNLDVGARTIEFNKAEYFVRGIGYLKSIEDIENSVVKNVNGKPIYVKNIAKVFTGPKDRRGILDKDGDEAVGGVIVARYGENPLKVIETLKTKIREIEPGLPKKYLPDGSVSQLKIVPFYDRSKLIKETLGTLNEALNLEILVTIIVIIVMVMNIRASALISFLIPVAVLFSFIGMKYFNVDANIVALSGIAIAIGTIADVGIVLSENMIRHLHEFRQHNKLQKKPFPSYEQTRPVIFDAVKEVLPSVVTAIATTVVSFIPVFAMEASEGKLFRPLAFTKTFVLLGSLLVAAFILPALGHVLFSLNVNRKKVNGVLSVIIIALGIYYGIYYSVIFGVMVIIFGLGNICTCIFSKFRKRIKVTLSLMLAITVAYFLTLEWMPMGASRSIIVNFLFTVVVLGLLLSIFILFHKYYHRMLEFCLEHKLLFLSIPASITLFGFVIWFGFGTIFGPAANMINKTGFEITKTDSWNYLYHKFQGTGKEFMPSLDEGSFLLMPTSMPHSGIVENKRVLRSLDRSVAQIPEIESVVGKLGRVESPLDPAPISMYENVINYKSEYITDEDGTRLRFRIDENDKFVRDGEGRLIEDNNGRYFRQWRDHIRSADDIWNEIVNATKLPGVTSAPKLQPIETRLVMLQTGMRAPMGIKVSGSSLEDIERFSLDLEKLLKEVPVVKKEAVFAERIVGKPYLELNIDRKRAAWYGLTVRDIQKYIETLIGGMKLTTMYKGRERYGVRLRYPREFRDSPDQIGKVEIPTRQGITVPLSAVADIEYVKGPQMIKSENTFLIGYVIFDKVAGHSEVDVVNTASNYIDEAIKSGKLNVPAGVSYAFTGNYENQVRAEKRLFVLIPIVLFIILLILYLQFKKIAPVLIIYSAILVAFSGGFIMIWLYGQNWFLDFNLAGLNMREIFSMQTIYLSVAVWVGFIALFGIATDDGVLMASYLEQIFKESKPNNIADIRKAVIKAGSRRIRPCLMTTATTILALMPVLTSTGRGADIMKPMAIPVFGGMTIELITLFVVPVLYAGYKEFKFKRGIKHD